jgi:hypothetical protein
MVIETRNNTEMCAMSTPIRAASVFVKKKRRGYRHRMEPTEPIELENISGATVRKAREKLGLSRPEFCKLFLPKRIIPETIRKIEKYIPGVADTDAIKASGTKLRVCIRLGLLPSNVNDTTKGSQEPGQREGRGDYLPYFRPRLAEGGYMSVATTKAKSTTDRPPYIEGKLAWAMEMVGDSMWPEFRHGATLFVNPEVAPEIGMGCVFLSDDRTRFKVLALVEIQPNAWLAQQWNPPGSPVEVLSRVEWPICDPIEAVHAPHKRGLQK